MDKVSPEARGDRGSCSGGGFCIHEVGGTGASARRVGGGGRVACLRCEAMSYGSPERQRWGWKRAGVHFWIYHCKHIKRTVLIVVYMRNG